MDSITEMIDDALLGRLSETLEFRPDVCNAEEAMRRAK
jgi:hypothetical protein